MGSHTVHAAAFLINIVVAVVADSFVVARESTVRAKHFAVNNGRHGQAVEHVIDSLPDLVATYLAKALDALRVEAHLAVESCISVDSAQFVISAQQENLSWATHLLRQEERYNLEALLTAVDIIAEKEERASRQRHAKCPQFLLEKLEIVQIAMDITKDVKWAAQLQDP